MHSRCTNSSTVQTELVKFWHCHGWMLLPCSTHSKFPSVEVKAGTPADRLHPSRVRPSRAICHRRLILPFSATRARKGWMCQNRCIALNPASCSMSRSVSSSTGTIRPRRLAPCRGSVLWRFPGDFLDMFHYAPATIGSRFKMVSRTQTRFIGVSWRPDGGAFRGRTR
jgi:hypothetical protein